MEVDKNYIDLVIVHYLTKKINNEEMAYLNQWISESEENKRIFENLKKIWAQQISVNSNTDEDKMAQEIWQKSHGNNYYSKSANHLFIFYRVAAVLLLVISLAFILEKIKKDSDPVLLNEVTEVVKMNPDGQKSQIMLPDGTKVWLNADSKIVYPGRFSDTIRLVKLEGEAYFDVAEDTLRAFTVKAGNVSITALGTSFNIEAFDTEAVEVSLVSGKVNVTNTSINTEPVLLTEGLAVKYNDALKDAKLYNFDLNKNTAWRHGILIFDNDNFDEFINKIERWYGVNVNVVGQHPVKWDFHAEYNNTYLKDILNHISYSRNFTYELNEKELTIWIDKK